MGNKQATGSNSTVPQAELRINHANLQNARVVVGNGQKLMKVTMAIGESEYNNWADSLLKYHKSTSKILMPVKHSFSKAGLCGQLGTVDIYYPCFPYLLSSQIHDRNGRNQSFSQQEMWYLLFSMAKAKKQNECNGKVLGDIRPKTIFLNEEGSIKLPNKNSWPYEKSKLQKALSNNNTYLSPQELKSIENEKEFNKFEQAGEIFAVGLTLLSLANLVDYQPLYNLDKKTFDIDQFNDDLACMSLNVNYSQVLRGLILNLCSKDVEKRMDSEQLWNLLSKHEESIAKKNNFVIDNAPQKLHQGVKELRELIASIIADKQRAERVKQLHKAGQSKGKIQQSL